MIDAWPELPAGITDRPADVWEPLLAIADAAGGEWPARARAACVELCKVAESREASLGIRLLEDLSTVFGANDRLATEAILDALHKLDESPWSDLRGRPLDARGLAYRLRAYDVTSTKVKIDGRALQGYRREDLWDAWTRYLAPTPESPEPTEPPERAWSGQASEVPLGRQVPEPTLRPEPQAPAVTCAVPEVPPVPLSGGGGRPATAAELAELDAAEEVLRRAGMLPGGVPPAPTAFPLRDEAGRPTAWTPAREPVGDCFDCGSPTFTVDEDGHPCHPGCALEEVP